MMWHRYISILIFGLFASGFAAGLAEHDLIEVTVEGEAPGASGAAYQAALVNAQREAILQILETTLDPQEFSLAKPLVAHPEPYIMSAEVKKRSKASGATRVTVAITVNETALKFDLAKIFLPKLEREIRVLVLIAESLDGTPARVKSAGVAQAKLNAYLTEGTLNVVPSDQVVPHYSPSELAQRIAGAPEELAQVARENLADVIIAGTARVGVEQTGGANLLRNEAQVELRVVTAQDARLQAAYTMTSAVQAGDVATGAAMAVEDAVEKLQRRAFITTAIAALRAEPAQGVVITISGLQPDEFESVVHWLSEQHGEEAVNPLHFAPTRARIRVDYTGGMGPFMDALTLHAFPGFRLDNKRAFGRSAELVVAGRQTPAQTETGPES